MKRILLLSALTICALAFVSCKENQDTQISGEKATANEIPVKKYLYEYADQRVAPLPPSDSEYQNQTDSINISVNLDLDLPEENSVLANRIREWVSEQISNTSTLGKMYFEGNLKDGQAIADYYGNEFKKCLEESIEPPIFNGYREVLVTSSKLFENQKCVTWQYTISQYAGGAHGFLICYGATFRKSDGRKFGHDLISDKYEDLVELYPMMLEGLCEYFDTDQETVVHSYTESSVTDYSVALPAHGPWLVKDGVDFLYQQYEIAAYAAGMPCFTIPYEKIKGLLSPAAEALLKQDNDN